MNDIIRGPLKKKKPLIDAIKRETSLLEFKKQDESDKNSISNTNPLAGPSNSS